MLVLHIIDASSLQSYPATLALLADSLDPGLDVRSKVLLLGGQELHQAAAQAGLTPGEHVTAFGVPAGRAPLGLLAVRRRLPSWLGGARPDLIHCWSLGALALAAVAFRSVPRLLTLTVPPSRRDMLWLRAILRDRGSRTNVLTTSATRRRELIAGGLPPETVHTLLPSIALRRINAVARNEFREHWEATRAGSCVVALLGDPPIAPDALFAMMAVSMVADSRGQDQSALCLLVHSRQCHRQRAAQMVRHMGQGQRLLIDDRLAQPWEILPACDLALAVGPSAGGLSLAWAMAAGIPIVGEATYAISEQVEDHHSALLVKPGQVHGLARRIGEALADAKLAWRLRDTARHEAFSSYAPSRYREVLQTVYQQWLAGPKVEIPPLPATGGLRFHGRA